MISPASRKRMIRATLLGVVLVVLMPATRASAQEMPGAADAREAEVRRLERALQGNPGDVSLLLATARAHEAAGGAERALHFLEERLARNIVLAGRPPARAELSRLRVNAGVDAWGRGRHDHALTLWTLATAETPEAPEGWRNRISGLLELGRADEAEEVAAQARAHHPEAVWNSTTTEPGTHVVGAVRDMDSYTDPYAIPGSVRDGAPVDGAPGDGEPGGGPPSDRDALLRAVSLLDGGDWGEALPLMDSLAARPDASPDVFRVVGSFWLSVRQPDTASVILARGEELHPRDPVVLRLHGHARGGEGAWEEAADLYGRAARLPRTDRATIPGEAEWGADAWLRYRALLTAGKDENARTIAESLWVEDLPDEEILPWASAAARVGAVDVAERILVEGMNRSLPGTRAALGRLALGRDDLDRARTLFLEDAVDPEGGPFGPAFLLDAGLPENDLPAWDSGETIGIRELERRALQRAVIWLEGEEFGRLATTGSSSPDDASSEAPHLGSPPAHDPTLAELLPPDLEEIPLLLPDGRELVADLIERVLVDQPGGMAELDRLRRMWPDSGILLRTRARILMAEGRWEEALRELDHLVQRTPADGALQLWRGRALLELERHPEARRALFRALELDPGEEGPFRELLVIAMTEEEMAGALLDRLRHLQGVHPDLASLQEREIELLHRLGRLAEAAERAATFRPGDRR